MVDPRVAVALLGVVLALNALSSTVDAHVLGPSVASAVGDRNLADADPAGVAMGVSPPDVAASAPSPAPLAPSPSVAAKAGASCASAGCPNGTWFSLAISPATAGAFLVLVVTANDDSTSAASGGASALVAADVSDSAGTAWSLTQSALWCASGYEGCSGNGEQAVFTGFDPGSGSDVITVDTAAPGGSTLVAGGATAVAVALASVNPSQPIFNLGGTGVMGSSAGTSPNTTVDVQEGDFVAEILSTDGADPLTSPPPTPSYVSAVLSYVDTATSYPSLAGVLGGVATASGTGVSVGVTLADSSPWFLTALDIEQPPPSLTLQPVEGPPGTVVTATAAGFASSDTALAVRDASGTLCTISVSGGTGGGSCTFVPSGTNGFSFEPGGTPNTVTADGSPASDYASSSFGGTVAQLVITAPVSGSGLPEGPQGTTLNVTADGLAPATAYEIFLDPAPPTQVGAAPTGFAPQVIGCRLGSIGPGPDAVTTVTAGAFTCSLFVYGVLGGTFYVDLYQDASPPSFLLSATSPAPLFVVTPAALTFLGGVGTAATGPAGTLVTVEGTLLAPSTVYALDAVAAPGSFGPAFLPTPAGCSVGADVNGWVLTDPSGAFSCAVALPAGVSEGAGYAEVVEASSLAPIASTAPTNFTVTTASLLLTPSGGPVGTEVALSGSGFAEEDGGSYPYLYCFAAAEEEPSCPVGAAQFGATPVGSSAPGAIPASPAPALAFSAASAPWLLVFDGQTGVEVAATEFLTTTPALTLTPGAGPVGSSVSLAGSGFASLPSGYGYDYCFAASSTATACGSGAPGSFVSTSGAIPPGTTATWSEADAALGDTTLVVWDPLTSTNVASVVFTGTVPSVTLTPNYGTPGDRVQVTGAGFSLGGTVDVAFNTSGVVTAYSACSTGSSVGATITASAAGAFTCAFTVPSTVGADPVELIATDASTGVTGSVAFTAMYPLTFTESGLVRTTWEVTVRGPSGGNFTGTGTASGTGPTLTVWVPSGTFAYTLANVPGWTITTPATDGAEGNLTVGGAGASAAVTFAPVPKAATFLGLPATEGYAVLGVLVGVVAIAAAVGVVRFRRRNSRPPETGGSSPPPANPPGTP